MLGHAMDFFIPDVPLEQIRFAGLRLQRGGVGFYPTSGSPFVHLDTGSIRHWPRMTHDQLARVFPDGRTVHVPTDGNPLKGYELARADIEKRGTGDDASSGGKTNFLAALFKGKSNEDDEEGAAPAVNEKPASASVVAAVTAKSAGPNPPKRCRCRARSRKSRQPCSSRRLTPRSSRRRRLKPAAPAPDKADAKPQTPADIINARGFWGDEPATPKQATPAQIAALKAREAVGADPQPTASLSDKFNKALAYAPAASPPADRSNIVAASAPIPRSVRPQRNAAAAATEINTVVAKGAQGQGSVIATSTRLAAAKGNDIWMRVVMLAPSATNAMLTTVLGDTNMTMMRAYFVKPQAAVAMTFSDDPMMGMTCDRFTGSTTATLATRRS